MKAAFRTNKTLILSLTVLLLAGLGLFLGSSRLVADGDTLTTCLEDTCLVDGGVEGIGTVQGSLTGSTTVTTESPKADKRGLLVTPLQIKGSVMRGYLDGVGELMMWLDKSRPISGGAARAKQLGSSFPASQEMRWHLLMTLEALPGRTFRSVNPFVVRSDHVNAMPPQNAVFRLAQVVEFEDVDNPGPIVVRLNKGRAVINPVKHEGLRHIDQQRPTAEDAGR